MKDYTVYFIYLGLTCTKTDFFSNEKPKKEEKERKHKSKKETHL